MATLLSEAWQMAVSWLLVASVALPVGFRLAALARRRGESILPRYHKGFSRWFGIDVAMLAFVCLVFRDAISSSLESTGLFRFLDSVGAAANDFPLQRRYQQSTLVGLASLPILAWIFSVWKSRAGAEQPKSRLIADITLGIGVWCVLVPATFSVHFLVNLIMNSLEIPPDEHLLKSMQLRTWLDVALFLAGACVVAPVFEEMGYRRILVPWAARKIHRSFVVLMFAALASVVFASGSSIWGPRIFVLSTWVLAGGLVVIAHYRKRFPIRPALSLVSSASLFAAIHSGVWATPIPLFVLGLGLGWLVLRTKTATASIVAHGLFNAISAVHHLRGSL